MTRRLARIAAVLLTVTAALFAIGVIAEANRATNNESSEIHVESGNESGETSGSATAAAGPSEATETVLGIDVESPATASVAVVASLALAGGLWFTRRRAITLGTALFAALFAAFDIAEIAHQINESCTGLAVLAAPVTLGHAAAAVVAFAAGYRTTTPSPASN